ncbi:MAG: hypothetical protein U0235_16910 [Polyangiaceae bacterium]
MHRSALLTSLLLFTVACSAAPVDEPADDDSAALANAGAQAKVLNELTGISESTALHLGVDSSDAVWYSRDKELRIAGNSRYVDAPTDFAGFSGPWFAGAEGFVVRREVKALLGIGNPSDYLYTAGANPTPRAQARYIHPAMTVDETGAVILIGSAFVGADPAIPFEVGFYSISRKGEVRYLGASRRDGVPAGTACEARKLVATSTAFTAMFSCSGLVSSVVSVPRAGGEATYVVPPSSQAHVTDIAVGAGDTLYVAETSNDNARSAVYSLAAGKRTELGTALNGHLAYRNGKLFVGDASGKVSLRDAAGTRVIAQLGAPIVQLEPTSTGVAMLTRKKDAATIATVEGR